MTWECRGVQGTGIDSVWPIAWALLAPCVELDGGRYDEESVKEAIRRGDMQLFLAGPVGSAQNLAITTEIRVSPRQKWLNIKYVGGRGLPFAFDFLGAIETWAETQGCVGCEGYGRPECARVLSKRGYEVHGQTFQRKF